MSLLRLSIHITLGIAAMLVAAPVPQALAEEPRTEPVAAKIRKALAKAGDLEINEQPLDVAVNLLREQTGINFVIDQVAVPPPVGSVLAQMAPYGSLRLTAHVHDKPIREALVRLLEPHNLTYVIVGDTVYISTPEKAAERQFSHTVHIDVDAVPLKEALLRLAAESGANILPDPRPTKALATPVTVHLENVPLEVGVRLLADQANLEVARVSNVLYVTAANRAEKLQTKPAPPSAPPSFRVWPDGQGGFHLSPPAGFGGLNGFGGFAGLGGGLGGLGALGGIGGGLGALGGGGIGGIPGNSGGGGGQFGIMGVAPPVPLTPPLPGRPHGEKERPRPQPPGEKKDPQAPKPELKSSANPDKAPAGKDRPGATANKKPDPAVRPPIPEKKERRNAARASGQGAKANRWLVLRQSGRR
jgi:hypothetical protein